MLSAAVSLASPQALCQWIAVPVSIVVSNSNFSFFHSALCLPHTEEDELDNMETVKIKNTPFEQEYTFKDVISK